MPGLIQNQLGNTNLSAATLPKSDGTLGDGSSDATVQAKATTYDPATRTVDKPQTVAGQLDTILAEDSPYIKAAQTKAMEGANSRGLINSSIATGAGTQAAIAAALPVAQSDASANERASQDNQNAQNVSLQTGAQLETSTATTNANNEVGQLTQAMRGNQATQLAQLQGQYQQLIQSNASASQLFSNVSKTVNDIVSNRELDAPSKQAALDKQMQLLQSGLNVLGATSDTNLTSLLNFNTAA